MASSESKSTDASQLDGDSKNETQKVARQESIETNFLEPPDEGFAAWITLFGSYLVVFNTW